MFTLNEDCLSLLVGKTSPIERYCLRRTCKTLYESLTDQRSWKSFTEQACLINAKLVDYFAYHPELLTPRCFANALRSNQLALFLDLEKRVSHKDWVHTQHSVSFLNYAAASGNIKLFRFIHNHYPQQRTERAAYYAIKYGHLSMLSHLEQKGFLHLPKQLFCLAIQAGRLRILNWLRKKYHIAPSGHYYGYVRDSCKFCKCQNHAPNLFDYLKKMGCVFSPIGVFTACQYGNFYAFQTILENCPSARLVLSTAITGGNLQIIGYFLEKGFLPKEEDILQCTTRESFALLLENNPKADHEELCKKIAQKALREENIYLLPLFREQNAQLLLSACSLCNSRTIEILLSKGYKLELDCLFMACYYGNLKLVRFLLAQGLPLHKKSPYYALHGEQTEIFDHLIELGLESPWLVEMADLKPVENLIDLCADANKIKDKKFTPPVRYLTQFCSRVIAFLFLLEMLIKTVDYFLAY